MVTAISTERLAGRCGKLIFTGPIDHYFADSGLPKLTYRSLRFEKLAVLNIGEHGYYQPGRLSRARQRGVSTPSVLNAVLGRNRHVGQLPRDGRPLHSLD